jgi:hypothetical protein
VCSRSLLSDLGLRGHQTLDVSSIGTRVIPQKHVTRTAVKRRQVESAPGVYSRARSSSVSSRLTELFHKRSCLLFLSST